MNQSKIKTELLEAYREDENLLFKEFVEVYFKLNRQLLLLLYHTKLHQAILYTPKDWIQQPYVNSDELTEFLKAIFDMETIKEIALSEIVEEDSEDIIILSNLLEIEAIEDQRILFSKEYYTDNPMKIKNKTGEVAYIGTVLNDTISKELQKVFHKKIKPLEKPNILEETPHITPPKLEEATIKAIIAATEKDDEVIQNHDAKEEHREEVVDEKVDQSPKKKYQLFAILTTITLFLTLGLIAFSFFHLAVHHHDTKELVSETTELTETAPEEISFAITTSENYTTKQQHYGLDISHYNGNIVSLLNSKDSLQFVICKATQGNYYTDPQFKNNWKMLKDKKIIRGAYHFYDATVPPLQQAKHFLNVVGKFEDQDIAPVLDIEELSLDDEHISVATLQRDLELFLQYVAANTNRSPIIYVDASFANTYLAKNTFANYRLYLASWTNASFPELPTTWKDKGLFLWQKSDDFHYENTTDDLDVFFGDLKDLYKN